MELAKAARTAKGALEVLADDPAFPLDLKSWCRSSGATMEVLSSDETLHRVLVFPKGISREMLTTLAAPASAAIAPSPATAVTPAAPGVVALAPVAAPIAAPIAASPFAAGTSTARFDLRGLSAEALDEELTQIGRLRPGTGISLLVAPGVGQRAVRWCANGGHELLAYSGGEQVDLVLGQRASEAPQTAAIVPVRPEDAVDCALLVMHNDLEALLAALLVANSAAAQGMRTMIFFTFWGLNLLRADQPNLKAPAERVSLMQRLFKWMMPRGPRRQSLGQLNFGGAGAAILQSIMHQKNIRDLESLLASAEEQGVSFVACTMSMSMMGITKRDLEPYGNLQYGGAAAFVEAARHAQFSLVF
jgi:peroxiredoxin family protein/TusA-related sulfurtransferase